MFTTILIAIAVSICLAAFCYRFTSSDLGETIMVASLYVAVFWAHSSSSHSPSSPLRVGHFCESLGGCKTPRQV